MAHSKTFETELRAWRVRCGWSQEELASRSGLSRAGVSAIETGRLVPSAAAALALAAALGCRVEDLFRIRASESGATDAAPTWAWAPQRENSRYWIARVGETLHRYPTEPSPLGMLPHDGVILEDRPHAGEPRFDPERTLIMACCDPAIGLLAAELAREAGLRLIAFHRPSRAALTLLGEGLVHVAGIHLSRLDDARGNAEVVRTELGPGYTLLRVAHWEEGIALTPGLDLTSVEAALGADLRWIGREPGSGARQCLDELLAGRPAPRRQASGHRGVAEALRGGWADAGVCLRLVSEEAGLNFLGVRQEAYDLCFPSQWEADPRLKALIQAVQSPAYRQTLGELPGYDSADTGAIQHLR